MATTHAASPWTKARNVLDQQRHDVTRLEERRDLLEVRLQISGIAVGVIVEIRDPHIRYIERS